MATELEKDIALSDEDEESVQAEEEDIEEEEADAETEEEESVVAEDDEEEEEEEEEAVPTEGDEEEAEEKGVESEEETEDGSEENTKKKKRAKKTVINSIGIEMLKATKKTPAVINYEEDDDEEEEDDVNYLQKFDSKMRENFIIEHHPEARAHNYEEVKALTRVSRDGRGIIIDPLHKTIPFLTKYEMTRVIGQRAKQLDSGARAFVKVPLNVLDGYHIALLELEQKKLPFIIKRPYPNGGVEYWNVSDLEVLF
jgi:DNA-directed RNA polymerase subunit K/omega